MFTFFDRVRKLLFNTISTEIYMRSKGGNSECPKHPEIK